MSFVRNLVSLAAAALFFFNASAHAVPIVYEFSGMVSSGSLNGVGFINRTFTVDVFGDTSGIASGGQSLLLNPATAVTFFIAGVGSGTLRDAYRMFLDPTAAVGFSHVTDGADRIAVFGNSSTFAGYALASAFGPITGGPPVNFIGQFLPDATTAGPLEMDGGPTTTVTFRSFFPTARLPEAPSWLLLALGLAGLGVGRRKRA